MESAFIQVSRYAIPTIIILGTIGALANQILFHFRKQLRTTSCALYFRALSANDLLVLWLIMFPQWFQTQYQVAPTTTFEWYCKLYQYLTYTLYTLSPYFIVLACFDRLCTSSTNFRLRKIATIYIASFLIPSMIIFVFLAYSYVPILSKIGIYSMDTYCGVIEPLYNKILTITLLLLFSFIPPFLMIIFCTITFILLRQHRRRIMPVNQVRLRHRDNQLLKMLFIYVIWNIICIFPFTVTCVLQSYYYESYSPFTNPLVQILTLLVNLTYGTSFYIYTLGTPFYRDELRNLLKNIWRRLQRNGNKIIDRHLQRKRNTMVD